MPKPIDADVVLFLALSLALLVGIIGWLKVLYADDEPLDPGEPDESVTVVGGRSVEVPPGTLPHAPPDHRPRR